MLKLVLFLSVLGQLGCDAAPASGYNITANITALSEPTSSSNATFFPTVAPSSSSNTTSLVKATSSRSVGAKAASSSTDADRSKPTFSSTEDHPLKATFSFNTTSRLIATSRSRSSSTTKTFIPAPTAMGAGSTSGCYRWHIAKENDNCMRIETKYNITHAQFLGMNPEINANCTNLFKGNAYCVLGRFANFTSTASTPKTTTTKSTSVHKFTTAITSGMTVSTGKSAAFPTKNSKDSSSDSRKISTTTASRSSAAISSKPSSQPAAVYTVVVVSSKDDMRVLSRVSVPPSSVVSSQASTTSSPVVFKSLSSKGDTTFSTSTSRSSRRS